ncbi:MAG: UDP-N-acetylmuramoyl-L-alanyl-D-glutamate--2,6-diaminopimelate ligase [Epsilonproteobacteria bacterium]|nr:UDP-N-acetylmuramoyl-L-alanyl-D-glutamate--2,6-diaminopimelate ligase [Campylobacterota bacterium]
MKSLSTQSIASLIDNLTDDTRKSGVLLKTSQNAKYVNTDEYVTPKDIFPFINSKFIGITGTNGKTTTAFVLGYLLNSLGFSVGVQGTEGFYLNGKKMEPKTLTTPPILTTIKRAYRYKPDFFIMEVSSHAIAQNRIEDIPFSAKIFTSFSQDHLDYHKSMEEYRKIKESFFQDNAIKVINGKLLPEKSDDFSGYKKCKVKSGGYKFEMNCENLYVLDKPIVDDVPMAGEFNKMNFSLALKTAKLITNKSFSIFHFPLKNFKGVPGRMEIVNKNPLIIVDFAHTPDGMEKVLSSVEGKKIVVFGAGGERDNQKRAQMGEVASKYADYIIVTNDNPRCEEPKKIASDIVKGIKASYEIILNREEAIKRGLELAKEGYALFVLGKGDEEYIQFCDKKIPFSDREVIKKWLG